MEALKVQPRSAQEFTRPEVGEAVRLTTADGTTLFGKIFRPVVENQKLPVVLLYTPYSNANPDALRIEDIEGTWQEGPLLAMIDALTPYGYALACFNVRGTGGSSGANSGDGPEQAEDFVQIVEYLSDADWSNGNVGCIGVSNDAQVLHRGAVLAPRGLRTCIGIAGVTSYYDIVYTDGVPVTVEAMTQFGGKVHRGFMEWMGYVPNDGREVLPEHTAVHAEKFRELTSLAGDLTPWYLDRESRLHAADATCSWLFVQGLRDFNVYANNMNGWFGELKGFKRALIGQWGHEGAGPFGQHDGPEAPFGRTDWQDLVRAWFDQELLDLPCGLERLPMVQICDDSGVWRAEDDLDRMGEALDLELGRLGGPQPPLFGEDLPPLRLTSEPFENGLHVTGQARLELTLTCDSEDGHVALTLLEQTSTGDMREIARGYLSLPHRAGVDDRRALSSPRPMPPGQPVELVVQTLMFDAVLAPGSALVVELAGRHDRMFEAGSGFTAEIGTPSTLRLRHVPHPRLLEVPTT